MAEVLITLGIIGVVAVLVLPNVINYFKVKQLEAQFKRADNIITQAFQKSILELGYTSATEFTLPGGSYVKYSPAEEAENLKNNLLPQLNEAWVNQFHIIKDLTTYNFYHDKNVQCSRWFGEPINKTNCGLHGYLLSNGMVVTPLSVSGGAIAPNHPIQITFWFDTNGPWKGPNRNGYDIFQYYSYRNWLSSYVYCNPTNPGSANAANCYNFAHNNVNPNPYAKSKDYWDILYKPKSYWENK